MKFEKLTPQQAKEKIEITQDAIVVDVRGINEYKEGHIPNAISLPLDTISSVNSVLEDKNAPIFVYCKSGMRSKMASEQLVKMGYTNVSEFGGIINWPYEIVK